MDMRERRELSKDRFKAYQEEKKILAINSRQDDKNILRECHETNQKKASKDVDKVNQPEFPAFYMNDLRVSLW